VVDRLHFDVGTAQGDKTSFTDLLSTLTSDLARSILDASIPQKLALYTALLRRKQVLDSTLRSDRA